MREYRSFNKSREYIRSLEFSKHDEYVRYRKGLHPGKGELPQDIPSNPIKVYRESWISWGDYLGYKPGPRKRSFGGARKFSRSLNLASGQEWKDYCAGKFGDKPTKPSDIPNHPNEVYRDEGWLSMGDWLGTNSVAPGKRKFRAFIRARKFAQSLKLKNVSQWRKYCKGDMPNKPKKPNDIPVAPYRTYPDKWISFGDWLGTDNVSYWTRELRPFEEARQFARSLNLQNGREWRDFCMGTLADKGSKPSDIPANPNVTCENDGWSGMPDWLGTRNLSSRGRMFLEFEEARSFVQKLQIKTQTQWSAYCKGQLEGFDPRPDNIPATPARYYAESGWIGFGDWLGTGRAATHLRNYRPFAEARAFTHSLKLGSQIEWREFAKSGKLPLDFPASPIKVYRDKGWSGWRDWLGTSGKKSWRAFEEARDFARALHLKSQSEWLEFTKSGKLPSDIPARPEGPYETEGFSGYKDWLGNERWSFQQSREYVWKLKLRSNSEWRKFSKSKLRPENIPANPDAHYRKQGWISWRDWLGTDKS